MKLWQTYSSEHSARVKIIGTFESSQNADEAAAFFNRLLELQDGFTKSDATSGWRAIADACLHNKLSGFLRSDASQLRSFETVFSAGTEIRVETGKTDIQPLLKVLMHYGARIEILHRAPCSH